jgi:hypothetical protein
MVPQGGIAGPAALRMETMVSFKIQDKKEIKKSCQTGKQYNFYFSFEKETEAWYYFNLRTGESQWTHPLDTLFQQRVLHERGKRQEMIETSDGILEQSMGDIETK